MANDKSDAWATKYACKCLNVRISSSLPPSPPPDGPRDSTYTPVFVQDDGISVTHPQVTVRLTSKSEPIPGTSKRSRFTILTCLFCDLPVYRVHHTISPDIQGNESTLFPTEDWVEHEIMKSASGWIDVHKDCIAGERMSEAESSSSYAPPFSVILPLPSSLLPSSPETPPEDEELIPEKPAPEVPTPEYLSNLRPLFLPPPFTSSHPIFILLAELADKQSQGLRAAAEQRIADLVKAETAGLETKEKELKRQVEVLWKNFSHNLETVQQDRARGALNTTRSVTRETFLSSGVISPSQIASSVTVRNFVPETISTPIHALSSSAPRVSALSASLATTKFHHPDHRPERRLSATESTISVSTPRSESSTLVHTAPRGEGSNVLQFNRNIDDNINTQASYRYLVNLDEDMQRYKHSQEEAIKKQEEAQSNARNQEAGPSVVNSTPKANGNKNGAQVQTSESRSSSVDNLEGESRDTTPSRGRDKGKRKVTFDIQPAVVTRESEDSNKSEDINEVEHPMIFPLEDLEDQEATSAAATSNQLPLLEQPPSRPLRERSARLNSGLETFTALRPSSLPSPSHTRPVRSQPGVDSFSHSVIRASPRPIAHHTDPTRQAVSSSFTAPVTENDAAILKLVAADTPSHRGAWTPESKAWQTFTRRRDPLENAERDNIPEEGEGDEDPTNPTNLLGLKVPPSRNPNENETAGKSKLQGVPASLPVNVFIRNKPRELLTLASYRPGTVLAEEPVDSTIPPSPGKKAPSSAGIRKAMYAERDRSRAMDPGFLDFVDFTTEKEDEEQSEESEQDPTKPEDAGEKARKQALKILQARSELPTESMWRSLA